MERITEENRTIFIGGGISPDGFNSVEVDFDRFDRVTYTKDEFGILTNTNGAPYTQTPIPGPNTIQYFDFTSNGDNSVMIQFELTTWGMYVTTDYLTITTDQAGLNLVSITPGGPDQTMSAVIEFDGPIDLGTTVTITGTVYNLAYWPNTINQSDQKIVFVMSGFGNTFDGSTSGLNQYCSVYDASSQFVNTYFYIDSTTGYTLLNGSTAVPNGFYLLYDTINYFGFGSNIWVAVSFASSTITGSENPAVTCYIAPPAGGNMLALDAGNAASYSGSGATWNDLSGNGNNVTLSGGYGWSSADGGYITFDGVDAFGEAVHSASLSATTGITVEYWVNHSASGDYIILSKAPYTAGPPYQNGNYMMWYGDGYLWFVSVNSSLSEVNLITNYTSKPTNTWAQYVFTFDGSSTSQWYINGTAVSTSYNQGPATLANTATTENLYIGKRKDGYGLFNGKMSIINIWDYALTSTEVTAAFDANKSRYGL